MLYLIRGLPGSGKSTLARELLEKGQVNFHYEADMYHMVCGVYCFNPDNVKKAHAWCESITKARLLWNESVAVSNTFTRIVEMLPYLEMAEFAGHSVKVFTMTENYGSIHNVPENVIANMKARWEEYP